VSSYKREKESMDELLLDSSFLFLTFRIKPVYRDFDSALSKLFDRYSVE
jgi:hypothetical protein